jgi:hypothetical protein
MKTKMTRARAKEIAAEKRAVESGHADRYYRVKVVAEKASVLAYDAMQLLDKASRIMRGAQTPEGGRWYDDQILGVATDVEELFSLIKGYLGEISEEYVFHIVNQREDLTRRVSLSSRTACMLFALADRMDNHGLDLQCDNENLEAAGVQFFIRAAGEIINNLAAGSSPEGSFSKALGFLVLHSPKLELFQTLFLSLPEELQRKLVPMLHEGAVDDHKALREARREIVALKNRVAELAHRAEIAEAKADKTDGAEDGAEVTDAGE